ncbi:MAG: HlyD family secretion protein [Rhodospirillaceae bacterium]
MLETLICALFTILPDFLVRRYVQGKRLGKEITFFSIWYELRWGITTCAMATATVLTIVFYYHPGTTHVSSYFRTLTLLPQSGGRVDEVFVRNNEAVKAGAPIFRLDDASQKAAVASAKSQIAEVEASIKVAEAELAVSNSGILQAEAALSQDREDYERKLDLLNSGSGAVPQVEVDRAQTKLEQSQAQYDAAVAQFESAQEQIDVLLPAQKASAEAALAQAEVELEKTLVTAGVDGRIEQFALQVGDYVSPVLRPAGILVPDVHGRQVFQAGFDQLSAQVIKPGMIGEIGCMSQPFTIVPMVVVAVQDVIPSGQFRPSDRLGDPQNNVRPGSVTVFMEPLYEGAAEGIPRGSNCLANVYTDNHALLHAEGTGTLEYIFYHVVDTIGVVHAAGLRLKMILMPVQVLLLSGH